ncbi:hypothetical protein ACP51X_001664 [Vibrio vulnificus]
MVSWLRNDLSNKLIWWMKPSQDESEVSALCDIVQRGTILGEIPPYVHGDRCTVSFTEAPVIQSARLLLNAKQAGLNFIPFGFHFDRNALYQLGARQTIHQRPEEVKWLPDSEKYRHVDLLPDKGVDFTWKREWRLATDELAIDPALCQLILPNRKAHEQLQQQCDHLLMFQPLFLEDLS